MRKTNDILCFSLPIILVERTRFVATAQVCRQHIIVIFQQIVRKAFSLQCTVKSIKTKIQTVAPRQFDQYMVGSEQMVDVAVSFAMVVQMIKGCDIAHDSCDIELLHVFVAIVIANQRSEIDGLSGFIAGEGVGYIEFLVMR